MERLPHSGGLIPGEIFPCIICSSASNSIQELHNHQKSFHTSEELSLSVICLVHYMCVKNKLLGSNDAFQYPPFLQNHANNYLFYGDNNRDDNRAGVIYNLTSSGGKKTSDIDESFFGKTKIGETDEMGNQNSCYSIISAGNSSRNDGRVELIDARMMSGDLNAPFFSGLEIELCRIDEISHETFLKSVEGICRDLESVGRSNCGARVGQGLLKPSQKRNRKRTQVASKALILSSRKIRGSNSLLRSQTPVADHL